MQRLTWIDFKTLQYCILVHTGLQHLRRITIAWRNQEGDGQRLCKLYTRVMATPTGCMYGKTYVPA